MKTYFARHLTLEGDKLGKLFLCSRDIHPDDLVLLSARSNCVPQKLRPRDFEKGKELGCYKIIGAISSKAAWVEDGDEFEETDWRWGIVHTKSNAIVSITIPKEHIHTVNKKDFHLELEIKGPCGHFH